jgi:hypothetical protein
LRVSALPHPRVGPYRRISKAPYVAWLPSGCTGTLIASPQNAIAQHDVGLILLAQPATGITPVKVAGAGDRSAEKTGETASILGYGLTRSNPLAIPKSLKTGHMSVISTAAGKVGQTLTCHPPPFAGSPSTLSSKWILNLKTVSTTPTLTVTRAMIGHFMGCTVTARNASGRYQVFTGHVNRVRVTG